MEVSASPLHILRRIFQSKPIPDGLSKDQLVEFMDHALTEFEDSGFLEQTKLMPIQSEEEFIQKLQEHRNDLMVIKFWKRKCIPCLSTAEMYKIAEQHFAARQEGEKGDCRKQVHFYSVDIKSPSTQSLVRYQMVEGTPTIQTFHNCQQVGSEIQATTLQKVVEQINARI